MVPRRRVGQIRFAAHANLGSPVARLVGSVGGIVIDRVVAIGQVTRRAGAANEARKNEKMHDYNKEDEAEARLLLVVMDAGKRGHPGGSGSG